MNCIGVILLVTLVLLCCQAIIERSKNAESDGKEDPERGKEKGAERQTFTRVRLRYDAKGRVETGEGEIMACNCCLEENAIPLWTQGPIGQIVRRELHLSPDSALCGNCWKVAYWTLRQHWIAEGTTEAKIKFDDCGED